MDRAEAIKIIDDAEGWNKGQISLTLSRSRVFGPCEVRTAEDDLLDARRDRLKRAYKFLETDDAAFLKESEKWVR